MKEDFLKELEDICGDVKTNEPMKNHTTFRIGGNADYYVSISSEGELANVISLCRREEIKFYIIGNGSNLLVRDEGFRGLILEIGNKFNKIEKIKEDTLYAQSGAMLSRIAAFALDNSLAGLEFASGIPGTLGGGVVMNAGAYGGELKDVITSVKVLDKDGAIKEIATSDMEFGYRHSIVMTKGYIVLGATIRLKKGNPEDIKALMNELNQRRRDKQPLEYPSAGSTFKRPEGYFAGKLIEDCKLKGYAVGGAMVSEKHSGFVINTGDATASDVIQLINDVRNKVRDTFGVELEPEVKIL